jgi:hypothetical protein
LRRNTSLTVGYVQASHGYHQILSEDMNEPVPTYASPMDQVFYPANAPYANPNLSQYHLMGVSGQRAFTTLSKSTSGVLSPNGFQFRGNYTYSKNLDDGSAWNTSVSGNTPAYRIVPAESKTRLGPRGHRRTPGRVDQRQLRTSLWAQPALPERRVRTGGLSRRRLDDERHLRDPKRLPVLAAARL